MQEWTVSYAKSFAEQSPGRAMRFSVMKVSVQHKSPLAQVDRFHDLVTDRRLGVVSTSEPGDKACHFFLFIHLFI